MNKMIQWPRSKWWEKTFSPIVGCRKVSPACDNCWAEAWASRFGQSFEPHSTTRRHPPRNGVVFCGPETDLFGCWRSDDDILEDLEKTQCKGTIYVWLTKRAGRMARLLNKLDDIKLKHDAIWFPETWYSKNYFGFTAENQEWYDRRRDNIYNDWPLWANLWVSCEPLLGPIDLKAGNVVAGSRLKWCVVGCESGANRRPCKIEWIEGIVEQCREANVPVFVKQVCLRNNKFTRDINEFPDNIRIRQVPWAKD